MDIEIKLDKIFEGVSDLKADVRVLTESLHNIDQRGCNGGLLALKELRENEIKEIKADYTFIKRMTMIGTAIGTMIASSIGYFSGHK